MNLATKEQIFNELLRKCRENSDFKNVKIPESETDYVFELIVNNSIKFEFNLRKNVDILILKCETILDDMTEEELYEYGITITSGTTINFTNYENKLVLQKVVPFSGMPEKEAENCITTETDSFFRLLDDNKDVLGKGHVEQNEETITDEVDSKKDDSEMKDSENESAEVKSNNNDDVDSDSNNVLAMVFQDAESELNQTNNTTVKETELTDKKDVKKIDEIKSVEVEKPKESFNKQNKENVSEEDLTLHSKKYERAPEVVEQMKELYEEVNKVFSERKKQADYREETLNNYAERLNKKEEELQSRESELQESYENQKKDIDKRYEDMINQQHNIDFQLEKLAMEKEMLETGKRDLEEAKELHEKSKKLAENKFETSDIDSLKAEIEEYKDKNKALDKKINELTLNNDAMSLAVEKKDKIIRDLKEQNKNSNNKDSDGVLKQKDSRIQELSSQLEQSKLANNKSQQTIEKLQEDLRAKEEEKNKIESLYNEEKKEKENLIEKEAKETDIDVVSELKKNLDKIGMGVSEKVENDVKVLQGSKNSCIFTFFVEDSVFRCEKNVKRGFKYQNSTTKWNRENVKTAYYVTDKKIGCKCFYNVDDVANIVSEMIGKLSLLN